MGFLTQLRINSFPKWDEESIADSLVLHLFYKDFGGDTITKHKINVYELQELIDIDLDYYSNEDYSMKNGDWVGSKEFIFKTYLDTSGNVITTPDVEIRLSESLLNKFFNADSTIYSNAVNFQNFFYGLNIETEQTAAEGNYAKILTKYVDSEGNTSYPCYMSLHYHNLKEDTTSTSTETKYDTIRSTYYFDINQFAARINNFRHEYSNTVFDPDFKDEGEEGGYKGPLLYVQSTGGTRVRFSIPSIDNIIEYEKLVFNDSINRLNAVLTKVELVFSVDTIASDYQNYPLPSLLMLSYIDENDNVNLESDYVISENLKSNYEYRFNITNHYESVY